MMFNNGSEDKEAKEMYNFGNPDPSTTNRMADNTGEADMGVYNFGGQSGMNRPENSWNNTNVSPQDIQVNLQDESYSPREATNEGTSPAGMPTGPSAFGAASFADGNNTNYGQYSGTQITVQAEDPSKKHHEGGKTHAAKAILGVGKKSKKGKTDEEKKQIDLEERWKNALAEEERLNKVQEKINQVGSSPGPVAKPADNFPPRFLCIRPFMYHSFSTVVPERRVFVMIAFWEWLASWILLFFNMIVIIIVASIKDRKDAETIKWKFNKPLNIVLAVVYILFGFIHFFTWYWRIYRNNSTRRGPAHLACICFLIISLAWNIFVFIGAHNCGVCGVMLTIYTHKVKPRGLIAPVIVVMALFLIQIGFSVYFIVMTFIYYRKDLAYQRALRRAAGDAQAIQQQQNQQTQVEQKK